MKKYRIAVADSNHLFAELIKKIITDNGTFDVCYVASSGVNAIKMALEQQANLLILGSLLPDITMFQVVREIVRVRKDISFLFILRNANSELLKFLGDLQSVGVIKDDTSIDGFFTALKSVAKGERYISGDIIEELRGGYTPEAVCDVLENLTPREREVLFWISKGCSNREIAERIILSEKTIKNHVSHVLKKLDISDRTKAASIAWEEGLALIPEEFFLERNIWH
ncbi:MAG: response regulator transcription factor [Synergistaceae bacterium]